MKGVEVKIDRTKEVMRSLRMLTTMQVMVGVPSDETERKDEDTPINNAQIAYLAEYGSAAANIPARPVLIPGVTAVSVQCAKIIAKGAADSILGGFDKLVVAMNKAGLIAQASVRKTLTEGQGFEPLAESTLKARERDGFKGKKPLIVTGQLRNAYNYVVRKRG